MLNLKSLRLLILCLVSIGCSSQEIEFNEIKRPHEILKTSELNTYLQIVRGLSEQTLPPLPPLFAPLPNWDVQRELSVKGLAKEQQKAQENRWFTDAVLGKLASDRRLRNLLQKHKITLQQFLGLTESINLAAARTHFEEISELIAMRRTGQFEINELLKREDVFSNLSEEEQYEILRQAAWLTRVSRASELLRVPEENTQLLKKHWDVLKPCLHPDALCDPLEDIVDNLKHYGLPFEESPGSGFDSKLRWSPANSGALIGHATEKQLAAQDAPHR